MLNGYRVMPAIGTIISPLPGYNQIGSCTAQRNGFIARLVKLGEKNWYGLCGDPNKNKGLLCFIDKETQPGQCIKIRRLDDHTITGKVFTPGVDDDPPFPDLNTVIQCADFSRPIAVIRTELKGYRSGNNSYLTKLYWTNGVWTAGCDDPAKNSGLVCFVNNPTTEPGYRIVITEILTTAVKGAFVR